MTETEEPIQEESTNEKGPDQPIVVESKRRIYSQSELKYMRKHKIREDEWIERRERAHEAWRRGEDSYPILFQEKFQADQSSRRRQINKIVDYTSKAALVVLGAYFVLSVLARLF